MSGPTLAEQLGTRPAPGRYDAHRTGAPVLDLARSNQRNIPSPPPPAKEVTWTMNTTPDMLTAARAAALFTSHLSAGTHPTRLDVTDAISSAVRTHGGTRGCAAEVAAAYGDHPETAAPRMRWAGTVIKSLYHQATHHLTRAGEHHHQGPSNTSQPHLSDGPYAPAGSTA